MKKISFYLGILTIILFTTCKKEEVNLDWISGEYDTGVNGNFLVPRYNSDGGISQYIPEYDPQSQKIGKIRINVTKTGDHIFLEFDTEKINIQTIALRVTSIYESYNETSVRFEKISTDQYRLFSSPMMPCEFRLNIYSNRDEYSQIRLFLQDLNSSSDTLYQYNFIGSK